MPYADYDEPLPGLEAATEAVCHRCKRPVELHREGWLRDHTVSSYGGRLCRGSGEKARPDGSR